jgi:biopolymer transport protein ExbD
MAGGGSQDDNPVAINVVAMVDIIFCLCLFFMCSLKFRPLDAKLESWLPKTQGDSGERKDVLDEMRVILSWNAQTNQVERLFGHEPVLPTTEGDERLKHLIKDTVRDYKARGNPNVPLILDAGPEVPWTCVVDVMDLGRDAGVQKIQFACGTALK